MNYSLSLWSEDIKKNTLLDLLRKMLQDKNIFGLYLKFYKNYNNLKHRNTYPKFDDFTFNIITLSNIIYLLTTIENAEQTLKFYFDRSNNLLDELFNCDDHIYNICKFLNEEDKLLFSQVNNKINTIIKTTDLCPLFYKLNDPNFYLENVIYSQNLHKIIKENSKILKCKINNMIQIFPSNLYCLCEYYDNGFYILVKNICNYCDFLRPFNNSKPLDYYYGYDPIEYAMCGLSFPKYNHANSYDLIEQDYVNNKDKFLYIREESKIIIKAILKSVNSSNNINNYLNYYKSLISYYKKIYIDSKNLLIISEKQMENRFSKYMNIDGKYRNNSNKHFKLDKISKYYNKNQFRYQSKNDHLLGKHY